ncbi:HU family DNA-binding protein [Marivita hallyeonensis]|uniref:DNA-binding protein n=1 Tax=Marivita hallyeonensis TaxID=996342 RepID=A0A1M5RCT6_9RHOB|nr:HU family DNA-binding protein [Marivita hallyeonensis]SHH24135.1 DNA-binding protein [Marivita hallyeonensis]
MATTSKTEAPSRKRTATPSRAKAPVTQPDVVVSETPTVSAPELKKKELIDAVVARSGVKKRDAKPVIEAMLAVLGETIADGRELNLAPMGKMKVTRMKRTTKAHVITTRLRRNESHQASSPDPLAQAAE